MDSQDEQIDNGRDTVFCFTGDDSAFRSRRGRRLRDKLFAGVRDANPRERFP